MEPPTIYRCRRCERITRVDPGLHYGSLCDNRQEHDWEELRAWPAHMEAYDPETHTLCVRVDLTPEQQRLADARLGYE